MENKKSVTAVDWLYAHLLPFLNFSDVKEREYFRKCLEEAKEMDKQQIIESYCMGCLHISENETIFPRETSEQYYNETYGK